MTKERESLTKERDNLTNERDSIIKDKEQENKQNQRALRDLKENMDNKISQLMESES